MNFRETPVAGAYVIDPELLEDERGFFTRTFCRREFEERGLDSAVAQCSLSGNLRRGTLRGLHWQNPPHAEVKLVRCSRGSIFDVIVDIRPQSPGFGRWFGVELSDHNRSMLYIPPGCAHGFQSLVDNAEVFYQISKFQEAGSAAGIRWDDPSLAIGWPFRDPILSERDRLWPSFEQAVRTLREG